MSLPPDATPHSRALYDIAQRLAELCPAELGAEIALAGSISRGWADEYSDIEINFWTAEIPTAAERVAWLEGIGATRVIPDQEQHENGSWWVECEYGGAWVEAGWHSFAASESLLRRIFAGDVKDMFQGSLAESIHHALPLRDGEHLREWRSWLREYPDALGRAMVQSALQIWLQPRWFILNEAFFVRPDPALVAKRTDASIRSMLRILFAVNRQWEPDLRKWIRRWADTLALKPERLAQRLHAIYEHPLTAESQAEHLALMDKTLALVPAEYADAAQIAGLRDAVTQAKATYAKP